MSVGTELRCLDCRTAPQAGGAIHVGVEAFQASSSTSAGQAAQLPAGNATAAGNVTAASNTTAASNATAAAPAAPPQSPYATVK